MPKRINLPVNKLVNQPNKPAPSNPTPTSTSKPVTFEQLFQQARKQHHNYRIPSPHSQSSGDAHPLSFPSHQSSQNQSDSAKTTGHTPQNSNRLKQYQKLNRSLQAKNSSRQKSDTKNVRSMSNERYRSAGQTPLGQSRERIGDRVKNGSNPNSFSSFNPTPSPKISPKQQPKTMNSSPKHNTAQFKVQFNNLISKLDHSSHSHLREVECFLSIQEIFQILKQLHYLRKIEDEKYLVKLWQQLQGDTYGGIPSMNLYQFLTFINHYDPTILYPNNNNNRSQHKKILINSNLKIVADQQSKLEIYQQYLAMRVNRILYGAGQGDYQSSGKKPKQTSNIKIVDEDSEPSQKKVKNQECRPKRLSFARKMTTGVVNTHASQSDVVNARKSVKLRCNSSNSTNNSNNVKKQEEVTMEKDKSQETICYSQISQTKQSGKNLSNQSQTSIQNSQGNEQPTIDRKPILSIDVNLGQGLSQKLLVFEGQSALEVSKRLVDKYSIDQTLRMKFQAMLNGHIRNLLWRIEEVSEDLTSDREE